MDPGPLAVTLKNLDAKLRALDSLDSPSAPLDAYGVLEQARLAETQAAAFFDKLADKTKDVENRFRALEKDWDACVYGCAKAKQELNQARVTLDAAKAALGSDQATAAAPTAREEGLPQHIHADLMQAVLQAAMLTFAETEDKAQGKDFFLQAFGQRVGAALAGNAAQVVESPPQTTPGAPQSGAPAPAGTAPLAVDGDGRLQQRTSVKIAAVEESRTAFLARQEAMQLKRKDLRAAAYETLRVDSEAGEADGRLD